MICWLLFITPSASGAPELVAFARLPPRAVADRFHNLLVSYTPLADYLLSAACKPANLLSLGTK
jgi:hypothetical protein